MELNWKGLALDWALKWGASQSAVMAILNQIAGAARGYILDIEAEVGTPAISTEGAVTLALLDDEASLRVAAQEGGRAPTSICAASISVLKALHPKAPTVLIVPNIGLYLVAIEAELSLEESSSYLMAGAEAQTYPKLVLPGDDMPLLTIDAALTYYWKPSSKLR